MSTKRGPDSRDSTETAESITKVLEQSEHVEELVKESADELATVNAALKHEIERREPLPGVQQAPEASEAVETKVGEAAEKLTVVNQALEGEVRDRHLLHHELAAVREQEEAARHASFHDVLTGLPNRALFNDRLKHGIAQASRHGWTLAVMFLDLDKFKAINDTHGHEAGDIVLKEVAHRLKDSTRGDDTISRFGGDEFLYLLMEARDRAAIALVAQKLFDAIQAPMAVKVGEVTLNLRVGLSIGIAVFPKNGATGDTLITSADTAMYQAKKQSAARYAFAA
jgi:diguanylate cyclase (GGDEF)-like protein